MSLTPERLGVASAEQFGLFSELMKFLSLEEKIELRKILDEKIKKDYLIETPNLLYRKD